MENHELKKLFELYLQQKASPEEVAVLLRHFHLTQDSEQLLAQIQQEMSRSVQQDNVISLEETRMYERVEHNLLQQISRERATALPRRRTSLRIVAAIAAIAVLAGSYFVITYRKPELLTIAAPYGKELQVMLPDSSEVWLNAGTTIIYPKVFPDNTRKVTLVNGDAYFEVVHQYKPFVVQSKSLTVTVLGTAFEVNDFKGQQRVSVAVRSGKVGVAAITKSTGTIFLEQGRQGTLTNGKLTINTIDTADITPWREQRMIFSDQPLTEVFHALERRYNVRIDIQNPALFSERINMRLNNQPLPNVLSAISFSTTHHFTYHIANEQLIVVK